MKSEQESIKRLIDDELAEMKFGRQEDVLERTFPRSWQARLSALWNRELRLPLLPIGLSCALLITITTAIQLKDVPGGRSEAPVPLNRELIEAGGNTYWSDEFEKAVGKDESNGQS
ncbi:hypothetical protein [Cohnella lupini]|uniref:DUF3619 family protein n=1 Tax=Cohnella lupini TaxID=1294267 RepID=A0A3D9IUX7_9BACL|nr:hypothetical protein [Cohnella lupini]RED64926.1 hypothetical protein DFP95_102348 [Cohnella lupini]